MSEDKPIRLPGADDPALAAEAREQLWQWVVRARLARLLDAPTPEEQEAEDDQ